ncbi:hypothetical protein TDB9533_03121 [Thalassocella blandensis]|nr:hypothetical protein TDB9533_03121 [Thalassocella blandensis]
MAEQFSLQESLTHTYQNLIEKIIEISPQFLGAIFLLFLGWIAALVLRAMTKRLVLGFDWLFRRIARSDGFAKEKIKNSYATIAGNIVFWIVMLFFFTAAGNMLGWEMFSGWINSVINHLPNLITGLLIILAGFLLGNGLKTATATTASTAGFEQSELIGRIVQALVIVTAIILGTNQIGINVHLLSNTLIISIGVLLWGGALAFGLGAKSLIANIIGSQTARKHCRIGETLTIGEISGVVVEVTQTSIILDSEKGRIVIPGKEFQSSIISLSTSYEDTNS